MVRKDKTNINKFKKLLAAGGSDSPAKLLKAVGVDINKKKFWAKGLNEVESLLSETYALAKKLKKI